MPKTNEEEKSELLPDGAPNPKVVKDLWAYLDLLSTEAWEKYKHTIYLYRANPERPNERSFLEKFPRPITIEDVQERFGGGLFRILLKRGTYPSHTQEFAIEGEPKIARAPLETGRGSDSPALVEAVRQFSDLTKTLMTHGNQLDSDQRKMLTQGAAAAIELVKQQAMGSDASGLLETLTKAKEFLVPAKAQETSADKFFGLMMTKMVDRMFGEKEESDPLEKIDTILSVMDRLKENSGGGAAKGNPWAQALTTLANKADSLMDGAHRIFETFARIEAYRAGKQPFNATLPPSSPTAGHSTGQPAPESAVPAAEPQPPGGSEADARQVARKSLLVNLILNGANGNHAASVLSEVDDPWTVEFAEVLRSNPGSLMADPILSQVSAHPGLQVFVRDFLEYFEPEAPAVQ